MRTTMMRTVMGTTRGVALIAIGAVGIGLTGCAAKGDTSITDRDHLTVGVKYDQPGLGLKTGAGVQGFDVDVAKYIGRKLGVSEKNISFKEARSANRETFLLNGTVDMVIATYGITPARKTKVTFGGPYIITHQDVLVRAGNTSITSLQSLKNKRVCQVSGSNSWKNITQGNNLQNLKVPAVLVPAEGYQECVIKLMGGALDAVSTDATILAGYGQQEGSAVKVVNAPFTNEKYGVGLKKGDVKGCEAVNKAITEMYRDGTVRQLWTKWFGKTDLSFDPKQPPAEGCG